MKAVQIDACGGPESCDSVGRATIEGPMRSLAWRGMLVNRKPAQCRAGAAGLGMRAGCVCVRPASTA